MADHRKEAEGRGSERGRTGGPRTTLLEHQAPTGMGRGVTIEVRVGDRVMSIQPVGGRGDGWTGSLGAERDQGVGVGARELHWEMPPIQWVGDFPPPVGDWGDTPMETEPMAPHPIEEPQLLVERRVSGVPEGRKRGSRASLCPVPSCGHRDAHLKLHVEGTHLPILMWDGFTDMAVTPECALARGRAIVWLCKRLLPGCPFVEAWRKVMSGSPPLQGEIIPRTQAAMACVCEQMGWDVPVRFTLNPLNSPACLLHWRALIFLRMRISAAGRSEFDQLAAEEWARLFSQASAERKDPKETSVTAAPATPTQFGARAQSPAGPRRGHHSKPPSATAGVPPALMDLEVPPLSASWWTSSELRVASPDRDTWGVPGSAEDLSRVSSESLRAHVTPGCTAPLPVETFMEAWQAFLAQGGWAVRPELTDQGTCHVPLHPSTEATVPIPREVPAAASGDAPLLLVDSHFHFDQSVVNRLTAREFLTEVPPAQRIPVRLLGGVSVYSDPASLPLTKPEGMSRIAVAAHPKKAWLVTDPVLRQIDACLAWDTRVALGVGFDFSERPSAETRARQATVFCDALQLVTDLERPVVLHLRGSCEDPTNAEPSALALGFMRQLPQGQAIHLNCFEGDQEQVARWAEMFPNAYFGYTATVAGFAERQREGLRAVRSDRLLLESNSPHLSPIEGRANHPGYLGEVARMVAEVRRDTLEHIAYLTRHNAHRLYF